MLKLKVLSEIYWAYENHREMSAATEDLVNSFTSPGYDEISTKKSQHKCKMEVYFNFVGENTELIVV